MDIISYAMGKKAGGGTTPTGTIEITSNGETNVTNYAIADVNVQPDLESKSVTITENTTTTITPTQEKDGLSSVEVTTNVPQPSGTINITENGNNIDIAQYALANVSVGGSEVQEKDVNFYDYDGTLVYSYTKNEFLALSEMPANPSHEGLTAQGWNWSFEDATSYVTNYGGLDIGQLYISSDGSTQIFITLDSKYGLNPTLNININGKIYIDWGDGTSRTSKTGTSISSAQSASHTYSQTGSYVIKIIPATEQTEFKLKPRSNNTDTSAFITQVDYYGSCINKIVFGTNVSSIDDYTFVNMYNLNTLVLPNNITTIGTTNAAIFSSGLNCLIIPKNVTSISAIQNSYNLKNLIFSNINLQNNGTIMASNLGIKRLYIPSATTSIKTITNNNYLEKIVLPNTITSMISIMISYFMKELTLPVNLTSLSQITGMYNLKYLKIPKGISSFGGNAFGTMYALSYLDFSDYETIPTITNNTFNSFTNNGQMQIIVPDALYDDWKAAQYWYNQRNRIIKASEYTS